jgi:hypothetical protein
MAGDYCEHALQQAVLNLPAIRFPEPDNPVDPYI